MKATDAPRAAAARRSAALLLGLALLTAPALEAAPRAVVRAEEAPYYTDVPVVVQVFADEFEESPQPDIEANADPNLDVDLLGVFPNVSSRVEIINGQMRQWKTVRYVYRYQVRAKRPGTFAVGPFTLRQGATVATAAAISLQFAEAPISDRQFIELRLPEHRVYVNQRFPVRLEWWISQQLAERLGRRQLIVPFFDRVDQFRFDDRSEPAARMTIAIQGRGGETKFPAAVRRATRNGEPYHVVTVERTGIALKPGRVELEPATVLVEEVVRWQRNVFGERIPSGVRRIRAVDEVRTLEVLAPPAAGRPESFTGIVGRGLTLEATANRSVVQVGDPIALSLSVAGDVVLDSVALPSPSAMGLAAERFRAPAQAPAGEVRDAAKHFALNIRIMDEQVREIPPLELSWFDPETERYATARTQPIAVSVRAAQVIGAGDVERQGSDPARSGAGDASGAAAQPERAPDPQTQTEVSVLTGAELSIETDMTALLAPREPWYGAARFSVAAHLSAALLILAGFLIRRRAARDPALVARQATLRQLRAELRNAARGRDLLALLSGPRVAGLGLPRDALRGLVAELEQRVYAPGAGADEPVSDALRARADALFTRAIGEQTA